MADRILGMGDVVSLVERAQEQFDEKEAKKMERKLLKNQFNFNDAHENFYNSAVGVLQSWLNEAYVHVGEHLSDVA